MGSWGMLKSFTGLTAQPKRARQQLCTVYGLGAWVVRILSVPGFDTCPGLEEAFDPKVLPPVNGRIGSRDRSPPRRQAPFHQP